MDSTVPAPKFEPGVEMIFFESQGEMFERHGTSIEGRAAGRARPEVGDFFQVHRPILDPRGKDGRDLLVLPDVCVEVSKEMQEAMAPANPIE